MGIFNLPLHTLFKHPVFLNWNWLISELLYDFFLILQQARALIITNVIMIFITFFFFAV